MARNKARERRSNPLPFLIMIEALLLGLAAMAVFALLSDQYDRAQSSVAGLTAVARATDAFIAMISSTPPTPTRTTTRTVTTTSTRTITPTPSVTPTPSISPTPTLSPTPSRTRTPRPPTVPPTPRPPTEVPSTALTHCGTINDAGTYVLGNDLGASGECITVKASYVVLECGGHAITGNLTGYGVAIRKYGLLNLETPGYVEVHNCHVSRFTYGIYVEAGDHLVIRNNDSSNNYDDTDPATRFGKFLGMTEGGGIRLNYATASQVLNNTALHQAIGIDVRYSNGVSVQGNTASDNSAWGINFLRTQNSNATGNSTADNVRKCTWGAGTVGFGCDAGGIVIQDGSNGITVANNTLTGRNGNGVFIKAHALPCGSNNSILGNTINSVLYNAVELSFCTGNKVNNNQIHGGLDGVWLGFAHDNEIRNNTISGMSNHGVISLNSRSNTVSGNQIMSSNEAIYFYTESYDPAAYAWLPAGDYRSFGNCLCGNTLQSNTVAVHLMDSTSNQVTNNTYRDNQRTFLVQGNSDGNNLQGLLPGDDLWNQGVAGLQFPVR